MTIDHTAFWLTAAWIALAALGPLAPAAAGEPRGYRLTITNDASSEANTESCAHMPCEVHDRRMTAGAEGGVSEHPGRRGDADIAPGRGWQKPELGALTITWLR